MTAIVSNIFIIAGLVFMSFGVIGLLIGKDFYSRLLVSSKIDIVGSLTLLTGVGIRHGISFFTGKIVLLIVILLILNPLSAHVLARNAYLSDQTSTETEDSQ